MDLRKLIPGAKGEGLRRTNDAVKVLSVPCANNSTPAVTLVCRQEEDGFVRFAASKDAGRLHMHSAEDGCGDNPEYLVSKHLLKLLAPGQSPRSCLVRCVDQTWKGAGSGPAWKAPHELVLEKDLPTALTEAFEALLVHASAAVLRAGVQRAETDLRAAVAAAEKVQEQQEAAAGGNLTASLALVKPVKEVMENLKTAMVKIHTYSQALKLHKSKIKKQWLKALWGRLLDRSKATYQVLAEVAKQEAKKAIPSQLAQMAQPTQ
jgi:hypothetical protein